MEFIDQVVQVDTSSSSIVVKDDIKFKQGKKMISERNYEAAIEFFSDLLESITATYGDKSIETAPVWYEYGNALLLKEEENPSDNLLGAAADEAKKQAKSLAGELRNEDEENNSSSDEDENGEEAEAGNEEGKEDDENDANNEVEDDATDMEIAWEALEVARGIYEEASRDSSGEHDIAYSNVLDRLGDLLKFNGNYSSAIEEYQQALRLRQSSLDAGDRLLAQSHFNLATAYIYNASEEGTNPLQQKTLSLKHYRLAKETLMHSTTNTVGTEVTASLSSLIDANAEPKGEAKDEAKDEEEKERKELCDELTETINALVQEIQRDKQLQASAMTASSSSSSASSAMFAMGDSTTTVGFGMRPPSSSAAAGIIQTASLSQKRPLAEGGANPAEADLPTSKAPKCDVIDNKSSS